MSLANAALTLLGEPPIISFNDAVEGARAVSQRYDDVRRAVLRAHIWNSAKARASLPKLATAPDFGYTTQYQLPSDALRVVIEGDLLDTGSTARNFAIEGRKLLTDASSINLHYIRDLTDVNEMDSLLFEAIAARLAAEIAMRITNSVEREDKAWERYNEKLSEARSIDSQEGKAEQWVVDEWLDARLSGGDTYRPIEPV